MKLASPQAFGHFRTLTTNPQLKVAALRQNEFADQSSMLTSFIEKIVKRKPFSKRFPAQQLQRVVAARCEIATLGLALGPIFR